MLTSEELDAIASKQVYYDTFNVDDEPLLEVIGSIPALIQQAREALAVPGLREENERLRKSLGFIREGLAAWLDNAQHNRQRTDKELVVGCLERLIVDADAGLKGPTQ